MWLQVEQALTISVAGTAGGLVARRVPHRHANSAQATLFEASLMFALYALWQYAGRVASLELDHALDRGRWIVQAERWLPLPSELTVQGWILPHSYVVRAANLYYAGLHMPAMVACLIWLFVRHRNNYRLYRSTIAVVTGLSLAIQLLPVAPPRMLPDLGFVDTPALYNQSVYAILGTAAGADQLSAMPSVHVGWAAMIGWTAWRCSTRRWRWIAVAHAFVTVLVVVATGNHYWADGLVELALLVMSWWLVKGGKDALRRVSSSPRPSDPVLSAPKGAPSESSRT